MQKTFTLKAGDVEHQWYVVDAGGTALLVQEPLGGGRGVRRPGERVTLWWDPALAVALRDAPPEAGRP